MYICIYAKEREKDIRKLNINLSRGALSVIKRRMMIQLQARLHAIELLEFDKRETTAFVSRLFVSGHTHRNGRDFVEVGFYTLVGGGVRKVSCFWRGALLILLIQ